MRSEEESLAPTPQPRGEACCSCGCVRCGSRTVWRRCVKRKVEEVEGSDGEDGPAGRGECSIHVDLAARVDVENEVAALRDAVARHQKKVAEMCAELEQERAASASSATEAMSMILRLQREKAEVQMEARQFKRFAEEKMAHDQQELLILEDIVYKREQSLQALACDIQAFRHRLLSHGVDPDSVFPAGGEHDDEGDAALCDYPAYHFPLLGCCSDSRPMNPRINDADLQKSPPTESPDRREHLRDLERRILYLERTPSKASPTNEMEIGVVMGSSLPNSEQANRVGEFSSDAVSSLQAKIPNRNQQEEFPMAFDGWSDLGGDDGNNSDRVYTIDAVHSCTPTVRVCEEQMATPREFLMNGNAISDREETEIQRLHARLRALEVDRESMKQAIMSMQTEKAQVLLKEIAQQIYKDAPPSPRPARKLIKKQSFLGGFSFMSAIKWAVSLVFWRKAPRRARYMFDEGRVGLLLILENSPLWRHQWRRTILPRLGGKATIGSSHRPPT